MAGPGTADQQHRQQQSEENERRSQVGLDVDERERDGTEAEDDHEPSAVELSPVGRAVRGQANDERDLGDLGRLELVTAELEPRLRALAPRADRREHGKQQQHGAHVQHGRELKEKPVVDRRAEHEHHEADSHEDGLPFDVVMGVDPLGSQTGAGRAVDHHEPEDGNDQGRDDKAQIHVPPRGGEIGAPGGAGAGRPAGHGGADGHQLPPINRPRWCE